MRHTGLGTILALSSALAFAACSDGGTGPKLETAPRLEASASGAAIANGGSISVSATGPSRIDIKNTGNGALNLRSITIESNPPNAFTVESVPMPTTGSPIVIAPEASAHAIYVSYNAAAATDISRPTAKITLGSNQTIDGTNTFVINVNPVLAASRLVLQPPVVDFGTVQANQNGIKPVTILNTGSAELVITGFYFSGHPGFSVDMSETTYGVTAESASAGITFPSPIVVPSGASKNLSVTYRALGEEAAQGSVVFLSNDPLAPTGTTLQLFSNVAGPCVKVTPSRVDFGGKLIGQASQIDLQIESCGDRDLEIRSIVVTDDPAGVFDVLDQALTFPIVLAPNESVTVPVTYFPQVLAVLGENNQFLRDEGILRVTSNAYLADLDVELSGFGTDGACPIPVITVTEGDEVLPQTTLHLSARNSTSSTGAVTRWLWTIDQPQGSASTFFPGAERQDVTFEANIVGEYRFTLNVWDAVGTEACSTATYLVVVTSDEAIRVELLWDTPGDPNQTDTGFGLFGESTGSDMDLHFLHPNASNQYFHSTYDCNWLNINPNWGGSGPLDNPRLDRDDTDGAGPENLNLSQPEFGATYRVGVHYWDDWAYGPSKTTIRVYIYGQLREQWANVNLVNGDLWDALTIGWPSQAVTRITSGGTNPSITSNYNNGFFP